MFCSFRYILLAVLIALLCYYTEFVFFFDLAVSISNVFIKLLGLVSIPIVFFSVVSTISGFSKKSNAMMIFKKTVYYTILTTIISSTIALFIYLIVSPANSNIDFTEVSEEIFKPNIKYTDYILSIIPSNFIQSFLDNNVIGVVFLSFLIGFACISLEEQKRLLLHNFFAAIFECILKICGYIMFMIPIAIWSFVLIFIHELQDSSILNNIGLYVLCVVLANTIQAFLVLPSFLWFKRISPLNTFKGVSEALVVAFFSKSSNITLPTTLKCVKTNLGLSNRVSSFSIPLCTTINMNACAAFILITVLFVSESNGFTFSALDMFLWVILSTIAAVGNAGVPMGCYFMSITYLVAIGVPIKLMGLILPIYSVIDMIETATNVWSDVCVTSIVDKQYNVVNKQSNDTP